MNTSQAVKDPEKNIVYQDILTHIQNLEEIGGVDNLNEYISIVELLQDRLTTMHRNAVQHRFEEMVSVQIWQLKQVEEVLKKSPAVTCVIMDGDNTLFENIDGWITEAGNV